MRTPNYHQEFRAWREIRCTGGTAIKLGREKDIGVLAAGAAADVALFDLVTEPEVLEYFFGHSLTIKQRLIPEVTILNGKTLAPSGRETETLEVLNRANPWNAYT